MKRITFISICGAAFFLNAALFASPRTFSGSVTAAGRGVPGVAVTDGFNVVLTDVQGRYLLESDGNADFVYITRPSSYALPERNSSPCFYMDVSGEADETCTVNFELEPLESDETRHALVVWADPQVYEEHEIEYLLTAADDLKAHLAGIGVTASAGIVCGDIIGQYPEDKDFIMPVASAARESGIPFRYVTGNHDIDMSGNNPKRMMRKLFGPTYYSFRMGAVHNVILDNIMVEDGKYAAGLDLRQWEWLENDLKHVPQGSTVMVSMHIPSFMLGEADRQRLYGLLRNYDVHLLTAHEHYSANIIISDSMMEHVHPPLSGLFWQSFWSSDGVPWGYMVYEIDGREVEWHYKAVGEPRGKQFYVYGAGEDPRKPDAVVANVWNYDPEWEVCWYEDGEFKGEMTGFRGVDRTIDADVEKRREKEFKWKYIGAGETDHMFYAVPSSPDSPVTVEVTDRFGNVYRSEAPVSKALK